ncbi:MAG: hypothetical protein GF384_01260 [Elusimicrobia bacterium]|nr:hypothetical protein [Elusimicrobiota bacterium]MBD3411662.1 hypothetical protein [Elusimicrobiota bacterium]
MDIVSIIIRLVLAVVLGMVIGWEREHKGRSAGLRTHVIVCLGSALISLIALHLYDMDPGINPSRIIASVVTGIGFIGAGAIIRSQEGTRGLTTAASIWISAGIGLAVGMGFYTGALIVVGLVMVVLIFFKKIEHYFLEGS